MDRAVSVRERRSRLDAKDCLAEAEEILNPRLSGVFKRLVREKFGRKKRFNRFRRGIFVLETNMEKRANFEWERALKQSGSGSLTPEMRNYLRRHYEGNGSRKEML